MLINIPAEFRNLSFKQKLMFSAGAVGGLALFAPAALLALTTVTSIAMACVVGLLLFMGFSALPLILRWWRLQVLRLMKITARRNPVETLQLELIERKHAFERAGATVVKVSAMRDSLREKLDEYIDTHQTKDAHLERSIKQLSDLVDRLRNSLRQTGIKLDEFERFVARQGDRWKLATATGELAVLLKDARGGDVTEKFLQDEAIDTIRDSLNLSFAEIEQILQRDEIKQFVEAASAPARAMQPVSVATGGW
jgi:flagellar biosynthesis chaperone FliJ